MPVRGSESYRLKSQPRLRTLPWIRLSIRPSTPRTVQIYQLREDAVVGARRSSWLPRSGSWRHVEVKVDDTNVDRAKALPDDVERADPSRI